MGSSGLLLQIKESTGPEWPLIPIVWNCRIVERFLSSDSVSQEMFSKLVVCNIDASCLLNAPGIFRKVYLQYKPNN